jgi:hypothetical protein
MPAGNRLTLASTQAAFAVGLVHREQDVPREVTSRNCSVPLKRFNVHRNNVLVGLIEVLRGRYPVVERLVGEEFFGAMAREFVTYHPPRSPVLLEYGERFPAFLVAFEPAQELPYLPDVARLEWLRHAAYHAADAEPMAGADLAGVPADRIGAAVLKLHPSAGLIASNYPVLSIWETNAMDREVRRIGPEMAAEAVLVLRPRLDVVLMRLGPGGAAFIAAIGAGLAYAAAQALEREPAFSLPEMLGACLAAGAFVGFAL